MEMERKVEAGRAFEMDRVIDDAEDGKIACEDAL